MEDDPEWEIQEYSFSSILKCILKNGYVFGKNMVITGIVISSAPMVVVVFSAMGVGFGTYACTNKIMSILLPSPLDFEQQKYNHDDDDAGGEVELLVTNIVDEEDNEQMEDLNQGVDMNVNVDEKEMEHHVPQVIEEEEKEHIKQGVDIVVKLDIMNVDEKEGVEMRLSGEDLPGDDDESEGGEPLIHENKSNTWENIRDVNNTVEDDDLLDQSARDVERIEPVMVKEIDFQKLIMDGSKNNETVVGEMRHILILDEGNQENNFNARQVEELDRNKKERNTESDEQVMRESMGTREEKTISNDKPVLRAKKEYLIHSYADAREIGDESGLDLFDESIHFASLEAYDEEKENIGDENVDIAALPAFKRIPLAMENEKTNTKMASREDMLDEERIWEKIVAMRTIVGYKAPSQPECIGELKALYVFTGVEPPASFKDDSDLDEVDAKLKFLMSIVGVK